MLSYANDTMVIATGNTWDEAEAVLNNYLDEINNWMALNTLCLNFNKTFSFRLGIVVVVCQNNLMLQLIIK